MKNPVLTFIMFVIVVLVGIAIWDNYLKFLYANNVNTVNKTAPTIIPSIPYQFTNLIILIVGLVLMIAVIVGLIKYFSSD